LLGNYKNRIISNYKHFFIKGVSEIGALILTGNRTHQKEQLFSLLFWQKTLGNGLKKSERFS
jgi:ABC-type sulfate transport system permease component